MYGTFFTQLEEKITVFTNFEIFFTGKRGERNKKETRKNYYMHPYHIIKRGFYLLFSMKAPTTKTPQPFKIRKNVNSLNVGTFKMFTLYVYFSLSQRQYLLFYNYVNLFNNYYLLNNIIVKIKTYTFSKLICKSHKSLKHSFQSGT